MPDWLGIRHARSVAAGATAEEFPNLPGKFVRQGLATEGLQAELMRCSGQAGVYGWSCSF